MRANRFESLAFVCIASALLMAGAVRGAEPEPEPEPEAVTAEWPAPSLSLGDSGILVGGFVTLEADRIVGEAKHGELDATLFIMYQASDSLRMFIELELGPLVTIEGNDNVETSLSSAIERLQVDYAASDAFNLRVGKFLTPFGIWNQARAEPLVWTTSEPLIIEETFDDTVAGAMYFGSVSHGDGALSFALYGSILQPFGTDPSSVGSDQSIGGRLGWDNFGAWTFGASYFVAELDGDGWDDLAGIDVLWRPTARVEVSAEALKGRGSFDPNDLSGLYLQMVYETSRSLFAVARYENFKPPDEPNTVELLDLGVVWMPTRRMRLKADYRFGNDPDDVAERGMRMSLSYLF